MFCFATNVFSSLLNNVTPADNIRSLNSDIVKEMRYLNFEILTTYPTTYKTKFNLVKHILRGRKKNYCFLSMFL